MHKRLQDQEESSSESYEEDAEGRVLALTLEDVKECGSCKTTGKGTDSCLYCSTHTMHHHLFKNYSGKASTYSRYEQQTWFLDHPKSASLQDNAHWTTDVKDYLEEKDAVNRDEK